MGVFVQMEPDRNCALSLLPDFLYRVVAEDLVFGDHQKTLKEGIVVVNELMGKSHQVIDFLLLRNSDFFEDFLNRVPHLLDFHRGHVEPDELFFSLSEKWN